MVKVKPLVWTTQEPPGHDEIPDSLWAEGVGGHYHIVDNGRLLWMVHDPFIFVDCQDIADAKRIAQDDHDKRVRALIFEAAPWGEVRRGTDGELAIFSPTYNVVKARFTKGALIGIKEGEKFYRD